MSKARGRPARAVEILDALELAEAADRTCKTYSGGMRRRLNIGIGMVHRPALLFLDEPTTGLDPQARARLWDEIRKLRDRRHHGLPDDPLPRGSGRPVRPPGDHRPRPDRGRRLARRAEA